MKKKSAKSLPVQKLLVPLQPQISREAFAQMAESVDALVSNTSGAIHPGSNPGLGTKSCKSKEMWLFFYPTDFTDFSFWLRKRICVNLCDYVFMVSYCQLLIELMKHPLYEYQVYSSKNKNKIF